MRSYWGSLASWVRLWIACYQSSFAVLESVFAQLGLVAVIVEAEQNMKQLIATAKVSQWRGFLSR